MAVSVEQATAELIHTLGNFLGIVSESRRTIESNGNVFMTAAELGGWAMMKEPELRAALDNLKHARNVARIEAEDW